jgi:hypothetical protein
MPPDPARSHPPGVPTTEPALTALSDLHRRLDAAGIVRCGDGSCIFGRPAGMHTNGGCRCIERGTTTPEVKQLVRQMAGVLRQYAEERADLHRLLMEHAEAVDAPRGGGMTAAIAAVDRLDRARAALAEWTRTHLPGEAMTDRQPTIGHVSPDHVPRDPARDLAVLQAVTVEAQDAAIAYAHAVGQAAVRLAERLRDATTVAECRAAGRDFLGELRAANKPPGPIISALVTAHRATTEPTP